MWQDYVLTAGSIAFVLALIPAVRAKEKPARTTSAMTSFVLWIFAATDVTLGLYWTALTTALTASMWLVLLIQGIRLDKSKPIC